MATSTTGNVVGSGSDAIVLNMSEDAEGPAGAIGTDAEFTVNVDGQQIGGLQTVTASHSTGQTEAFTFQGNFAPGQHTVTVTFANNTMTAGDKVALSDGGDRNLYVNGVSYDGATVSSTTTGIYESPFYPPLNTGSDPLWGDAVYTVGDTTTVPANSPSTPTTTPAPVTYGSGNDTLDLAMGEDPYGTADAQFTVAVDGKQVGGTFSTSAIQWEGQQQHFLLKGSWGNGPHAVTVAFLNDAIGAASWDGRVDQNDRNLLIDGITYDGSAASGTPWGIFTNGSETFGIPASQAPTSTPIPMGATVGTSTSTTSTPVVTIASGGTLKDSAGNTYALDAYGDVLKNGTLLPGGGGTGAITLVNNTLYGQDGSSGGWYTWNGTMWASASAPNLTGATSMGSTPTTSPTPTPTATNSGQFSVKNGQIIDPNGNVFVARGINADTGHLGDAAKILADFPGLNFVRLAVVNSDPGSLPNPSTFASFIQTMTAAHVVVEIENHPWPQVEPYAGSQLTQETNWYASVAAMYKDNPYVWFGTSNEPENGQGYQTQISATYNAIRGTGSNAMIMAEAGIGGGNPQTVGEGGGYGQVVDTQAGFANFKNVAWDLHWYGGWNGTSSTTDTNVLSASLYGSAASHTGIAATQTITDADGAIPVIIGETGYAATGITDGVQVLQVAYTNPWTSGAVAWGWDPSPMPGASDSAQSAADNLSDGNGNLTTYGKIVAGYLAKGAASATPTPPPPPPTTTPPPPPPQPTGTGSTGTSSSVPELTTTSGGSLKDAAGNTWTLTSGGEVDENGAAIPGGAGTKAFAIVNGAYYGQDVGSGSWYTYSTATKTWTSASAPNLSAASPPPPPPVTVPPPPPPVVVPPPPPPVATASANDTVVLAGSSGSIIDAKGNAWTITSASQVAINGKADTTTGNVSEIAYVNGAIWQENTNKQWWGTTSTTTTPNWSLGAGTSTSPLPASPPPPPPPPAASVSVTDSSGVKTSVTASSTVDDTVFNLLKPGAVIAVVGAQQVSLSFTHMTSAYVVGGTSASTVVADSGSNYFAAGRGAMTVTGGSGADTYAVHVGSGPMAVMDFSAAKGDTIAVDSMLKAGMTETSDGSGGTLVGFAGMAGNLDLKGVATPPTISFH